MLTYEYNLLHAVAILLVPVGAQCCITFHHLLQFVFGHCGKPLSCLTDADLLTCLFEEVAHIHLVVEVADTLGTNHALGPFARHDIIKESRFEGAATIADESADAVLLSLALIVVVVMMLMVVIVIVVVMLVVIVVMMFVVVIVLIVIMMVVTTLMIMVIIVVMVVALAHVILAA